MDSSCECCGTIFIPLLTVKNQRYCQDHACQKARKKRWQKMKLSSDQDYRENQAACQKAWREKHPDYWKGYRAKKPEYTSRNRLLQGERNRRRRRKQALDASPAIAKMDESSPRKIIPSGCYRLVPVCNGMIAKMDECIVEIGLVSAGSGLISSGP